MFPALNWPDFQPMGSDGRLEEILSTLEESGFYVCENFIGLKQVETWKQYAESQFAENKFHESGIGRKIELQNRPEIRSDRIFWVAQFTEGLEPIGRWLAALSVELKNHFRTSVEDIEAHFSIYPVGSHYDKHYDNSHGQNERLFTFIFYLNPNWQRGDGGELIIYNPKAPLEVLQTIEPRAGTFVLFRSDLFCHQVLIANAPRFTFTGWLRRGIK